MADYKITRDDCIALLQKHLHHNDFEVLSHEEKTLSGKVDGIMAGHFRLHIQVKINHIIGVQTFFVKRMRSAIEIQNKMIQQQQVYEKEAFMYSFLDKVVELEPKYNLDITANCYFTVPNELFVLEDLSEDGYIVNKTNDFQMDIDQFLITMDSLAKFHSASIIYETKQGKPYKITDEYSEYLQEPLYRKDEEYLGNKLLKSGVTAVLALIELMPHLKDKQETKVKFEENADRIYDLVKPSDKLRNVICHGDLWSNNLLFYYAQDKPVHCKLIDFQALRYIVPAHDILTLLYYTLDNTFIRKYKDTLFRVYYKSLKKYLDMCDIDVEDHITWGDLEEGVKDVLPFVIVQKILFSPMCAFGIDERLQTDPEQFATFMYGDKTDLCVKFYQSNPFFKLVMDAAIANLDDL